MLQRSGGAYGAASNQERPDDEKLIFYTNPMSRGRITRWMLEELAIPYETVLLGYGGTMKSPDYLAINPMGKVPAIKHGDMVVTEGAAICAYLADQFPERELAPPPQSAMRGTYYRWLFFAAGPVEAAVTGKSLGLLAPEVRRRLAGLWQFSKRRSTRWRRRSPARPSSGETSPAADIYVGSQIYLADVRTIDKRPAFTAYADRLQPARPSAGERARHALMPKPEAGPDE